MNKKILVVDDDMITRISLIHVLKSAGYAVISAKDGLEALYEIRQSLKNDAVFDLIITDINLPKMSGLELIDKLIDKTNKETLSVPVIAMSANMDKELRHRLMLKGCDECVSKPFDEDYLLMRVNQVFDLQLS